MHSRFRAAIPDWLPMSPGYPKIFGQDTEEVNFDDLADVARKAPALRTPLDLLLISKCVLLSAEHDGPCLL